MNYFVVQDIVRIFVKIFIMKVTTISGFRANIKEYMNSVIETGQPVIINRGQSAAVLMSLDEYNSVVATEKIMNSDTTVNEVRNALSARLNDPRNVRVDISEL